MQFLPAIRERRWRVGANQDALFVADIAKPMRQARVEIIGVSRPQQGNFSIDGDFDLACDNDTAFFSIVFEHVFAGIGAWGIAFMQDGHAAIRPPCSDELPDQLAVADVGELCSAIERAGMIGLIASEESADGDRQSVKNLFQRADGWADVIQFDQRDGAVGDSCPFGEFALRKLSFLAELAQASADIKAVFHRIVHHGLAVLYSDKFCSVVQYGAQMILPCGLVRHYQHGEWRPCKA